MFIKTKNGRLVNLQHVKFFGPGIEENESIAFIANSDAWFVIEMNEHQLPGFLASLNLYAEVRGV